jgi:hypothetical protein
MEGRSRGTKVEKSLHGYNFILHFAAKKFPCEAKMIPLFVCLFLCLKFNLSVF